MRHLCGNGMRPVDALNLFARNTGGHVSFHAPHCRYVKGDQICSLHYRVSQSCCTKQLNSESTRDALQAEIRMPDPQPDQPDIRMSSVRLYEL